jgi:hypothetical protein
MTNGTFGRLGRDRAGVYVRCAHRDQLRDVHDVLCVAVGAANALVATTAAHRDGTADRLSKNYRPDADPAII